jgi:hypothetical protein
MTAKTKMLVSTFDVPVCLGNMYVSLWGRLKQCHGSDEFVECCSVCRPTTRSLQVGEAGPLELLVRRQVWIRL